MSENIDLNFVVPEDDGELLALTMRFFGEPEIAPRHDRPPRLRAANDWTPFRSLLLVRTVDQHTGGYDAVLGNARPGSIISFHLGCPSDQPMPETHRLVKVDSHYITVAEQQRLTPSMTSLGFIGTVPFPMLDALEVRRMDDGQEVLVAGEADPLRDLSEPLGTLGFIEPFPLRPRVPPGPMDRALRPLSRWFDPVAERHQYGCPLVPPAGAVCLGSIQAGEPDGDGYVALRLSDLAHTANRLRLAARARWAAAPLAWRTFGRRQRLASAAHRARQAVGATPDARPDDALIGYLHGGPAPHHAALYAAVHPITGDLFLTRSADEAQDMGYGTPRPVGWIANRGADRRPGREPIWFASRFGQSRCYREDTDRRGADDAEIRPSGLDGWAAMSPAEIHSAAGLATLGVAPGETKTLVSAGGVRALVVVVTPPQSSLLAIVADSHRRCAERCHVDYVVVSLLDLTERENRLVELEGRYESVYMLEPDMLLGPDADPFSDPDRGVVRGDSAEPFAVRRRRLLEAVANAPGEAEEAAENRR